MRSFMALVGFAHGGEPFRVGEYTADPEAPKPRFASYPGFLDAIPPRPSNKMEGRDIPYQVAYARPWPPTLYSQVPVYGTEYLHVPPLDKADAGYRAYVCDGRYNVFRKDATATATIPSACSAHGSWRCSR
jgi:hypothetical protein